MKEQFIPYDLALKLKELGFDELCFAGYSNSGVLLIYYPHECFHGYCDIEQYEGCQNNEELKAPLWQQAFEFLEEKFDMFLTIHKCKDDDKMGIYFTPYVHHGDNNDLFENDETHSKILDDSYQDIPGNHVNDELYEKYMFERKVAYKTYPEIRLDMLTKMIDFCLIEKQNGKS